LFRHGHTPVYQIPKFSAELRCTRTERPSASGLARVARCPMCRTIPLGTKKRWHCASMRPSARERNRYTKSGSGDVSLSRAQPVNVEIKDGDETHAGIQRRDRDTTSPILDAIFTHTTPLCCARRADVGPLECPVQTCAQGAPEAVVFNAPLKVTEIRGMLIHQV